MTKNTAYHDIFKPIIVLTAICLVISAALALTNNVTAPIIAETQRQMEEQARRDVLPDADGFELIEPENAPESVTGVYRATNGVGYVIMVTGDGYGGARSMSLACAIDPDGHILTTKVLSHKETAGIGSKVTADSFAAQFVGKDASLEGVDTITGATFSSKYYIASVRDAFAAYELAKEAA